MTRRILGLVLATTLTAACETEQPSIGCPVQNLNWSATYHPKSDSGCPAKASEMLGIQKFSTPSGDESFSIKPATLMELDEADPTHLPYSLGALAKEADADGFCSATDMAVAEKQAPNEGDAPGRHVTYRWSNVRILAIPRAPGTQMVADLEYTEDGCTAQYEVWAMWPGDVDCANGGQPDNDLCAKAGTINPDFATVCDPTLLTCVAAKRPPSLK
ncbi:MAG: hypothetical protein ACJ8AT_21665 [Hyalangium sp.]|uniref:hypothetical protein n=1 Tax=Hyalangium sp. TaxID=2028555 RepID=UPI00389AE778